VLPKGEVKVILGGGAAIFECRYRLLLRLIKDRQAVRNSFLTRKCDQEMSASDFVHPAMSGRYLPTRYRDFFLVAMRAGCLCLFARRRRKFSS